MPRPPRPPCPQCGGLLSRARRRLEDRWTSGPAGLRRYRCRALACGWSGLIDRSPAALPPAHGPLPRARTAAVVGLALAGVAGALAWWLPVHSPNHAQYVASLPPGEHDDGVPLPTSHPWRQVAAVTTASVTTSAPEPLTLRQQCAWGKPGRNPYRGTVEQALHAARLPADVVHQVADRVRERQVSERLTIANDGIVGQRSGQRFNPRSIAMTYGHTLCLGTRVNFPQGHQEQADLYEVSDDRGRRYAVMVPDVCGNVSVLSSSGEATDGPSLVLTADGVRVDAPELLQVAQRGDGQTVPEPGTLACVGAALGALAWLRRRR